MAPQARASTPRCQWTHPALCPSPSRPPAARAPTGDARRHRRRDLRGCRWPPARAGLILTRCTGAAGLADPAAATRLAPATEVRAGAAQCWRAPLAPPCRCSQRPGSGRLWLARPCSQLSRCSCRPRGVSRTEQHHAGQQVGPQALPSPTPCCGLPRLAAHQHGRPSNAADPSPAHSLTCKQPAIPPPSTHPPSTHTCTPPPHPAGPPPRRSGGLVSPTRGGARVAGAAVPCLPGGGRRARWSPIHHPRWVCLPPAPAGCGRAGGSSCAFGHSRPALRWCALVRAESRPRAHRPPPVPAGPNPPHARCSSTAQAQARRS
jgi:hypothetical protein